MKILYLAVAAIALSIIGWSFAQEKEAPAEAPPSTAPPTESIRPDQGVAFPVDI